MVSYLNTMCLVGEYLDNKCFCAVALDIINCTVNMSTRDGKTAVY